MAAEQGAEQRLADGPAVHGGRRLADAEQLPVPVQDYHGRGADLDREFQDRRHEAGAYPAGQEAGSLLGRTGGRELTLTG